LDKRYSTINIIHQYQLQEALHNMKQVLGQSINEFFSQMQSVWAPLVLSEPSWEDAKGTEKFFAYHDNI